MAGRSSTLRWKHKYCLFLVCLFWISDAYGSCKIARDLLFVVRTDAAAPQGFESVRYKGFDRVLTMYVPKSANSRWYAEQHDNQVSKAAQRWCPSAVLFLGVNPELYPATTALYPKYRAIPEATTNVARALMSALHDFMVEVNLPLEVVTLERADSTSIQDAARELGFKVKPVNISSVSELRASLSEFDGAIVLNAISYLDDVELHRIIYHTDVSKLLERVGVFNISVGRVSQAAVSVENYPPVVDVRNATMNPARPFIVVNPKLLDSIGKPEIYTQGFMFLEGISR